MFCVLVILIVYLENSEDEEDPESYVSVVNKNHNEAEVTIETTPDRATWRRMTRRADPK